MPLWMNPGDIALGEELCSDVERDIRGALEKSKRVSEFIATSLPVFVKHGLCARYGQYQPCSLDAHLLLFLSWGVLFEGLYRLVAHVHGVSVLQRSRRADGQRQFQYRMLDSRPDGLCTERILESLTAYLPADAQEGATKCLLIAVKPRNALSHGAVPCYGVAEHRAAGHLFAESSRILVEAARHKMTEVSAYYLRQGRGETSNTALDDWLEAKRAIATQFAEALARRFTLPSGEVLMPEN